MPIFLILGALALIFMGKHGEATKVSNEDNADTLPDVDSTQAHDSHSKEFDDAFEMASHATGVPFALIKAHAIRESALKPDAYRYENTTVGASYGLMQVLWHTGKDKFAKWGYPDEDLGTGDKLFEPDVSALLGAQIIADNLTRLSLRDAINAYNTGVAESVRVAPNNYVNDVLKYYSQIVGRTVS